MGPGSDSTSSRTEPTTRKPRLLAWGWVWAALVLLLVSTMLAAWQDPAPVPASSTKSAFDFFKPIEKNPHRRLVTISGAPLSEVTFNIDGLRGWAVGNRGTILTTSDGGKSWAPQISNTQNRLVSVAVSLDGLRGWAVGNGGTILTTSDGGKSWAPQTSNPPRDLYSMRVLADGLHGWAVGDRGTILATTDGGKSWAPQTSNTEQSLFSVAVLADGLRAWAVGDRGTILATTDGGKSWALQTSNTQQSLFSVAVLANGLRAWAVGDRGTILATNDGGKSWEPQTSNTLENLISVEVLADGLHGWAVGDRGTILATTDGGKAWAAQTSNTRNSLLSIAVLSDGLRGWAVGGSILGESMILATTDGGKSWVPQTRYPPREFHSVSVLADGLRGWSVGDSGTILTTSDGGKSWAPQVSNTLKTLNCVTLLADGLRGWAVGGSIGGGGTILATTDGGKSWAPQTKITQEALYSVAVLPDGLRAWAVGDRGTILATTDGGKSWAPQTSNTQQDLWSVSVLPDGLRAWAVGLGGTILATTDGGKSWAPQTSNTQANLVSVAVLADGLRGWAVGGLGTILATTDGGKSWEPQTSNTRKSLSSVAGLADGMHVWAVGRLIPDGGIILATTDGGKSWAPQVSNTQKTLNSVTVLADGLRGWAVGGSIGEGGTILATTDGGKTWANAETYRRYPAPWYGVAVLLGMGLLWQAWKQRPGGQPQESVADIGATDAEIRLSTDDKLEFSGLACGISRFLRNTGTRPPLTLAITGDWGSGKSSLMQLVKADLQRFGHRTLWFNAWHHQKEEHLFAALLGAVRSQAVPGVLTPAGLRFRLNLLLVRSRKNFWLAIFTLFAVTGLFTVGLSGPDGVAWISGVGSAAVQKLSGKPDGQQAATGSTSASTPPVAAASAPKAPASSPEASNGPLVKATDAPGGWQALAQIVAALAGLWSVLKAAKPFGVDPALLLAGVGKDMSVKTAAAQNDFRAQFAQEFRELTEALEPQRLAIFIDDLDRCNPKSVLDIMEAVNYLTSAGECFVVFGMATERVQAALGLAFKDIAAEMVELTTGPARSPEAAQGAPAATPKTEDPALAKRRAYARDYLQKLVNIEIKVPEAHATEAHRLLVKPAGPTDDEASRMGRVLAGALAGAKAISRQWPLALAALAVVGGLAVGQSMKAPANVTPAPVPVATPDTGIVRAAPPLPKLTAEPRPAEKPTPTSVVSVTPGESVGPFWMLGWFAAAVLLLLGALTVALARAVRQAILEVQDSEQFTQALKVWTPAVASKRATPRAIKRFGNRIRYLAMLQQGEATERTRWAVALDAVRQRMGVATPAAAQPATTGALTEHQLIAMGAIHELVGDQWRDHLSMDFRNKLVDLAERHPDEADFNNSPEMQIETAREQHVRQFGVDWPPSYEEQLAFERLLSGVRLSGDPEVIQPAVRRSSKGVGSSSSSQAY